MAGLCCCAGVRFSVDEYLLCLCIVGLLVLAGVGVVVVSSLLSVVFILSSCCGVFLVEGVRVVVLYLRLCVASVMTYVCVCDVHVCVVGVCG